MTDRPDVVYITPPQLVGTATVADALGLSRDHTLRLIRRRDPRLTPGYLGKHSGRHTWNAHELFAPLYTNPDALTHHLNNTIPQANQTCTAPHCKRPTHFLELCKHHINQHLTVFRTAHQRPTLTMWRLLAMSQWVVDRNQHLTPPADWDPWNNQCATPDCPHPTSNTSPLCLRCTNSFYQTTVAQPDTIRHNDQHPTPTPNTKPTP